MKTITVTDFRANITVHLESLNRDHDVLILTASKNRKFVVITLTDYNSIMETFHLLSTNANAMRLMKGIEEQNAGAIMYSYKLPLRKAKAIARGTRAMRRGKA